MKNDFEIKLNGLLQDLYSPLTGESISKVQLTRFINKTICVLPCGGESKRMSGQTDKHKTALNLPNGETIIGRTIKSYMASGIKRFVLLTGVNSESVIESVEPLLHKDIDIQISEDPGKPVGRGGAILYALEKGLIPSNYYMVIHNADDQIVGYPRDFLADICSAHILTEKAGGLATAIVALGTTYAYTAMEISGGKVVNIASNPMIPVPTHVGVTVVSPKIQGIFFKLFNYSEKKDFENYVFPVLLEKGQLYSFGIPGSCWFPVNDPKDYQNLINRLQSLP